MDKKIERLRFYRNLINQFWKEQLDWQNKYHLKEISQNVSEI